MKKNIPRHPDSWLGDRELVIPPRGRDLIGVRIEQLQTVPLVSFEMNGWKRLFTADGASSSRWAATTSTSVVRVRVGTSLASSSARWALKAAMRIELKETVMIAQAREMTPSACTTTWSTEWFSSTTARMLQWLGEGGASAMTRSKR